MQVCFFALSVCCPREGHRSIKYSIKKTYGKKQEVVAMNSRRWTTRWSICTKCGDQPRERQRRLLPPVTPNARNL